MPKNIVILFDGTSNEVSEKRTNVLRLYGTLEKSEKQVVYYDPGVGTLAASGSWFNIGPPIVELWGRITGFGIDQNVKDAYRFLVENYTRNQSGDARDSIYIFGFSRGAYTARVLAGFINALGLIEPRNLNLIDYAYRAYSRIQPDEDTSFAEIRLYERLLQPDRPPIRLLGLFDTVSSVIELNGFRPELRTRAFTSTNPSVESIRHAVAIDEHRTMFNPTLWPAGGEYRGNPFNNKGAKPQDVREVWFAGSHGDVGGGWPDKESGLAKVALKWMIDESAPCGVRFVARSVNALVKSGDKWHDPADPMAPAHNTMKWYWAPCEFLPRMRVPGSKRPALFGFTMPLFERRTIPEGACIHRSVIDREARYGRPINLPDDYVIDG